MNAWTPRTPPERLARRPVRDSPGVRAYLVAQGYAAAELPHVLRGRPQPGGPPGLLDAAELRVAELERTAAEAGDELDRADVTAARAGAVRDYLADHPPVVVSRLDYHPEPYLDAVAFGPRLVPVGAGPGSVQVLEDLITARRWWTVGEAGERAGLAVVAGALYRLVGVAAPAARLAELPDGRRAVHPKPEAWETLNAARLELHRETLAGELPADAWLGYRGGLAGLRGRSFAQPEGLAATLRLSLGSTLGRAGGRKAPTWGVDAPTLQELLDAKPWKGTTPRAMLPMAERLARLSDAAVVQAVALGQLETAAADRLTATLLGRRDLVARDVLDRVTGRAGTR